MLEASKRIVDAIGLVEGAQEVVDRAGHVNAELAPGMVEEALVFLNAIVRSRRGLAPHGGVRDHLGLS
jgi:hypothetical protein